MQLNSKRWLVAALSALALFTTQPRAHGAETAAPARGVSDVRLAEGMLRGQVVDQANAPLAQELVTISAGGQVLSQVAADANGRFEAPLPRGGVVVVSSAGDERVVRTWTQHSAPPAAHEGVLLVGQDAAVRGQAGGWVARNLLPIGLVGGAAAAIIIISTDNDENRFGS
jgi:hypothetical protein